MNNKEFDAPLNRVSDVQEDDINLSDLNGIDLFEEVSNPLNKDASNIPNNDFED